MRKAFAYIVFLMVSVSLSAQTDSQLSGQSLPGKLIRMEGAFLEPLQVRDSVLIADQVFYGFELNGVEEGTQFAFPSVKSFSISQNFGPWFISRVWVSSCKST